MSSEYIRKTLERIADLIERKNTDYDSAFEKACDLFQDYAPSKIYEKTQRIIKLSRDPNQVKGEGLEDALCDCIGYCALYLDRLNTKRHEEDRTA